MFRGLQKPKSCGCVAVHRPKMMEYHDHHVWPLADGGPDEKWNLVALCPTTHSNVHKIYREFKKYGMVLPRRSDWPKYAYKLAVLGFGRYQGSVAESGLLR